MDDDRNETRRNRPSTAEEPIREWEESPRGRRLFLAVALAGALLLVALVALLYRPLSRLLAPAPATVTVAPITPPPPTATAIVHYGPIVLAAIRTEATLQTYRLTFVNDVDITRPSGIGNICTERIVYLGYYDVTAGVDLNAITEDDIEVVQRNGEMTVTITLPLAHLTDVTLDTERSRLLVQETPKWVPGCETHVADMTLEAQQGIKGYATEAALQAGILRQAQEKAGFVLQRFLYSTGYPNVVIRYQGPE